MSMLPELTIVLAAAALLISLLNCVLSWVGRRHLNKQIEQLRQDQRANHSAVYGLAKHIRRIQEQLDQRPAAAAESVSLRDADRLVDEGADNLKLAEELGLSRNEAEIITHLRPRRTA